MDNIVETYTQRWYCLQSKIDMVIKWTPRVRKLRLMHIFINPTIFDTLVHGVQPKHMFSWNNLTLLSKQITNRENARRISRRKLCGFSVSLLKYGIKGSCKQWPPSHVNDVRYQTSPRCISLPLSGQKSPRYHACTPVYWRSIALNPTPRQTCGNPTLNSSLLESHSDLQYQWRTEMWLMTSADLRLGWSEGRNLDDTCCSRV